MRILLLTPYPAYPPHGGGVQRMYQFVRYLSRQHEVWCLSLAPSAQARAAAQPLSAWCNLTLIPAPQRSLAQRAVSTLISPLPDMALRAPSRAFREALELLLQHIPFDVVQACSIEMAQYAVLAQRYGVLTALDQWNAEYVLQRRAALTDWRQLRRWHGALYSTIQWLKLARYERWLGAQLDVMTVVSAEDAAALRRIGITKPLPVVPNGVDIDYFQPTHSTANPHNLLFTGTLDFRPNIDALRWFVQQVLPLIQREWPHVQLQVVGRSPTAAVQELARPGVEIVGPVADVRPYFANAAVYVLPMRMGGGVRLKLLEAFACGVPLVSTTMGADGVGELEHGVHCLLADTPPAFAHATVRLLQDRAEAQRLAHAALQLVHGQYAWSALLPRLEHAWAQARYNRV